VDTEVGRGTTFTITIPLTVPSASEPAPSTVAAGATP
jgi:hypothetical protein